MSCAAQSRPNDDDAEKSCATCQQGELCEIPFESCIYENDAWATSVCASVEWMQQGHLPSDGGVEDQCCLWRMASEVVMHAQRELQEHERKQRERLGGRPR